MEALLQKHTKTISWLLRLALLQWFLFRDWNHKIELRFQVAALVMGLLYALTLYTQYRFGSPQARMLAQIALCLSGFGAVVALLIIS